jgi:hypothetical protein
MLALPEVTVSVMALTGGIASGGRTVVDVLLALTAPRQLRANTGVTE